MNPESPNPYNALPDEHTLIEQYHPTYLARGGDHLVYEIPQHPDVVVKASTFNVKDILIHNAQHNIELDTLPDAMESRSGEQISPKEEIKIKNSQIRVLRDYFGSDYTLNEHRYIMKVPVTKQLLQEIFKHDEFKRPLPPGAENLNEVWSSVIVQEKSKEIADPNLERDSLHFGNFVEKRKGESKVDPEECEKLNNSFIKNNIQTPEDIERFLRIQDNPQSHGLADLIEKAKADPELSKTLQELIRKMISYAEDTGNILALAGKDNVILFKREGKWTYLLVDAIPIHNELVFKVAQEAVHKIVQGEDVWREKTDMQVTYDKELIMKAYNFIRTVNGLAASLNMQERLAFLSEEDQQKEIDLDTIIR